MSVRNRRVSAALGAAVLLAILPLPSFPQQSDRNSAGEAAGAIEFWPSLQRKLKNWRAARMGTKRAA